MLFGGDIWRGKKGNQRSTPAWTRLVRVERERWASLRYEEEIAQDRGLDEREGGIQCQAAVQPLALGVVLLPPGAVWGGMGESRNQGTCSTVCVEILLPLVCIASMTGGDKTYKTLQKTYCSRNSVNGSYFLTTIIIIENKMSKCLLVY